jgi:hypothetical protein
VNVIVMASPSITTAVPGWRVASASAKTWLVDRTKASCRTNPGGSVSSRGMPLVLT